MTQATWSRIAGVVLAVGCYVLAGTVLADTPVAGEVKLAGGLVLGWLGLRQPGQR